MSVDCVRHKLLLNYRHGCHRDPLSRVVSRLSRQVPQHDLRAPPDRRSSRGIRNITNTVCSKYVSEFVYDYRIPSLFSLFTDVSFEFVGDERADGWERGERDAEPRRRHGYEDTFPELQAELALHAR